MIKTYFPDVLCLAFIAALAFLIAGRPGMDLIRKTTNAERSAQKVSVAESDSQQKGVPDSSPQKALTERNIFAENGSYDVSVNEMKVLPENPYRLIAVLKGKEKKAVFREYTGAVFGMPVGKKMIDGFEVMAINNTSVKLRKEKEKKELKLFNADYGNQPASTSPDKNLPPGVYTLIGILGGREQKAVFRNDRGSISSMSVGGTLNDGSVISAIRPLSVKLRKEKKETELKMFDATKTMGR